ncbi:class I SAM-dependent methyltransferase [Calditrichota bacterium]
MKRASKIDPKQAIGGMWEEIGQLQFAFLVDQGLKSNNTFLDLGCGSLRGGVHFIRFLDKEKYYGVDISREILNEGKKFMIEEKLDEKNPTLKLINDNSFDKFSNLKFDFILAQSVLTHMPIDDIKELFSNVHKVMKNETLFFATFHDGGDKSYTPDFKNFYYTAEQLEYIGKENNLKIEFLNTYNHPRNQKMMKIRFSSGNYLI